MLTDQPIRHVQNDFDRRWHSDDYFDLIVWYEPDGQVHGFQLCYDKENHEGALTWKAARGFRHTRVDSGEANPFNNRTPILGAQSTFPLTEVRDQFLKRGRGLSEEVRDLVLLRLAEYEKLITAPPA